MIEDLGDGRFRLTVELNDPRGAAWQAARARHPGGVLDYLNACAAGTAPEPAINQAIGFRFRPSERGIVRASLLPDIRHLNPMAVAHGGVLSTLLDTVMTLAVHTSLEGGRAATTLELKVNLTRAVRVGDPELTAEGRVVHLGRRIGTAEGRVTDAAGRLYAHGTTTVQVLEPEGG